MLVQMKIHNEKFMAAFANNDPESIGPLYTADCKVMPSGQDAIEGREGGLHVIHTVLILRDMSEVQMSNCNIKTALIPLSCGRPGNAKQGM